jgi:hypothetical protein
MPEKTIQVAGDVCIDVLRMPQRHPSATISPDTENWRLTEQTHTCHCRGGALLLEDMIRAASKACRVIGPQLMSPPELRRGEQEIPLDEKLFSRLTREEMLHSEIRLSEFKAGGKDDKEKTLRVERAEGFSGPAEGAPTIGVRPPQSPEVSIVVLDDTGNVFRTASGQWPTAVSQPDKEHPPLIVHKLHFPLPLPVTGESKSLWPELESRHPERRVVVVSIDDLRADDIPISRGLSWERTALDLVWHLLNLPRLSALKHTPHLIVRLGLDGAVYWRFDGKEFHAWLVYDPGAIEGSWEVSFAGQMVAYGSAFTAGLVGRLCQENDPGMFEFGKTLDGAPTPPPPMIEGIQAGLTAGRRLLQLGFRRDPAGYPVEELFEPPKGVAPFLTFPIPIIPQASVPDRGYWRLIDSIFAGQTRFLHRAVAMVARGAKAPVGPEEVVAGELLSRVPRAVFADLVAYDRREIESYRALYCLMFDYLRQSAAPRPLSLAVFGPPGAGKSFGVKMVAKALVKSGSKEIEPLTFNLSQYRNADELAAAFHLVRDVVLRGKVPLVFFDEFDTALAGEPLGWLRYFLAPMQDAEFLDRGTPHPIGQSIFVFAGGTCNTYEEFARPFTHRSHSPDFKPFKDAKGPDFLSRLRGTLDIPGLDLDAEFDAYGPTSAFPCEPAILLRRANILAFQLRKKAPTLEGNDKALQVSEPVIRALLHLPQFAHGNRSFEALLDISHLVDQTRFTPSLLPAASHAALHANAGQLMQLLAKDDPYPPEEREKIAQAIHAAYLKDRKSEGPLDPKDRSTRAWDRLDEDLKESNRQQADHIAVKLRAIGLWFRKAVPEVPRSTELDLYFESNVERLARIEHDRWVAEKRRSGWIPAPGTDRASRNKRLLLHNFIHPWDRLTEPIKDLDRSASRRIPDLLAAGGYEVYAPLDNDMGLPENG